ncbi:MAG: acylphosphatase [Acidimicrobiia bacterium]|nr:acylphosphatase [Acidimicrobiia bacterium]
MAANEGDRPNRTPRAFTAIVKGRVQGVGFRFTTWRLAAELGVLGWVRNRPDGSVEVWAQGTEDSLAALASFLDNGPLGAVVTAVETRTTDPDPTLARFEIRP